MMFFNFWKMAVCALVTVLANLGPAGAQTEINYPVVFTSPEALEETGLSVRFYPSIDNNSEQPKPVFPNACFEVQDEGGYYLSVSDEFLAHYTAKGFMLRSLCLALVSQARFDPATGERLPTYVFRDPAGERRLLEWMLPRVDAPDTGSWDAYIPRYHKTKSDFKAAIANAIERYKRGDFETVLPPLGLPVDGFVTDELGFAVPDCFKNATPYLDCTWRYGMKSGRKTSPELQQRFKAYGEALDRQILDYIKNGNPEAKDEDGQELYPSQRGLYMGGWRYSWFVKDADGSTYGALYEGQPDTFAIPSELIKLIDYSFFVAHPGIPRGYGYALCATGEKDSAPSYASIEFANDRRRHSSRFGASLIKKVVSWKQ
jgi:hypothetical protein